MDKIKISVIIPVFNTEKYIKRCLISLIKQTLTEIEIICINDGSTDKSLSILKRFQKQDNRIKIIDQSNQGQSIARNNGIKIASGEYITFVDSDDWIDLDFFEKLYNSAKSTNSEIAVGGIIRLHLFRKKYHLYYNKETTATSNNDKFLLCDIPNKCYACAKIYKADFLKKSKITFEENRYFEDVIFTPQTILKANRVTFVPNTYYYYWRRLHSTVTAKNPKVLSDRQYANKLLQEIITKNNIEIKHKEICKRVKLLGFTILKERVIKGQRTLYLFNIIKL